MSSPCRRRRDRYLALGFAALAATLLLPSLHAVAPHSAAAVSEAAPAPAGAAAVAATASAHDPASCPVCLAVGKLRSLLSARPASFEARRDTPPRRLARRTDAAPPRSAARGPAAPRAPPA